MFMILSFMFNSTISIITFIFIFMSRKDTCWVGFWKVNLIMGWRWFMKSFRDWSWLVVPRNIMKMLSMNLSQNWIFQIKASRMVSLWQPMQRLTYGGATLVPMTVPTNWIKYFSINEGLLFFRMVTSNIPIYQWGFGTPGDRVSACNFM